MNGPKHYREAERLLREFSGGTSHVEQQHAAFAAAQVHATLALAAATAEPIAQSYDGTYDTSVPAAWSEAIS